MNSEFDRLQNIVIEAGEILRYYFENYDKVSIETKQDNSPVTNADIAVNDFLHKELEQFNMPIVSEETKSVQFGSNFFLLDPLDGTKQFIRKKPEFCISIAIVENNIPGKGIIYAPMINEMYAFDGNNFESNIAVENDRELTAVVSRGNDKEFTEFFNSIGITQIYNVKAAIKYGRMAAGIGDVNIRKFPISSWDIAAGYAILKSQGFEFLGIDGKEIDFSKPYDELNGVIVISPKAMKYKQKILNAATT
ncbi:MAG: 3'(2'),5'-bisphosphate nucleotidase CysQ [Alphaproteobacteria bacterium]|nr:3'(2'),5'-bisphosphate nucleotidase CysQ [Alphaproteobacteria bacterium]OJV16327.1 MAG: hypothetical protein BGO27_03670 [Alphaproteobacteria bacterium 33-17]